jgi:hypothetical protein
MYIQLGGFGPLFLLLLGRMALVVVVYTVAVGAQDNTLLYFLHSQRVPPVAYESVNAVGLGAGVFVVKIQRGMVIEPALSAVQRSLKGFPFFSQGRPFFLGALLSFFFCFLVVGCGVGFLLGVTHRWVFIGH